MQPASAKLSDENQDEEQDDDFKTSDHQREGQGFTSGIHKNNTGTEQKQTDQDFTFDEENNDSDDEEKTEFESIVYLLTQVTCNEKYRKSLHVTLALIFVLLSIFRFNYIVMNTVMNCNTCRTSY